MENQDLMMLENKLLIATPLLDKDPLFANTLVYVFEHNAEKGSAGVIVNKATNLNLMDVVERLDVRCPVAAKHKLEEVSILIGGPMAREDALILQKEVVNRSNKQEVAGQYLDTLTEETLEALIETDTIQDFEIILGYCRWQCGQLEQEIVKGLWLLEDVNQEVLFQVPHAERHTQMITHLGIDLSYFVSQDGHG